MTRRAVRPAAWPPVLMTGGRAVFALGGLAALSLAATSCRGRDASPPPADSSMTVPEPASRPSRPLADVIRDRAAELMALPGVVGIAEGALPDGSPCLRIYLERRTPEIDARLPRTVEGWPVDVEVSGAFRAMDDSTTPGGGQGR